MEKFKVGFIDKRGYKFVYMPTHPNIRKDGYIQEHRLVMEKHLKRYLNHKEVVHHINGNKGDNRINNLLLFSTDIEHLTSIPHRYKTFIYKNRIREYMREYCRERMRLVRHSTKRYKGGEYD